jgi:hypothetical protein
MHFKQNNQCADMHCTTMMSPKWCKSFGTRKFDKEMVEKELSKGCEEAHLHQLNEQTQMALAHCPNVGKFSIILYSFCDEEEDGDDAIITHQLFPPSTHA